LEEGRGVQLRRCQMAETPVLEAVARAGVGKGAARSARREGFVPGVIYGGGEEPQPINVKYNVLLKQLKAGRFLSTLINVQVDGKDNKVICRGVQRDVVKDLPTHVDFLRLSDRSRIALYIPVEYVNREKSPGLRRGGVLTEVRPEIELMVTAGDIPEKIVIDLTGKDINDTIHISDVELPAGTSPTITDRDFAIANIQAPSGLRSEEGEEAAAEAEG
jgi:large subunit ribosomal protein L25